MIQPPLYDQKPKRLWLLWAGGYFLSVAGIPGALLSFETEEAAAARAKVEVEFGVESVPVPLKIRA